MKKHIKTIAVMLAIILCCGGLLAILSDLLHVSNEERIQRAIDKIYTEESVKLVETIDVSTINMEEYSSLGEVKACYLLDNGDYLVLSTGKKGYSNGTVSLYVAISTNDKITVKNTVQDSYTGQTLMSKLSSLYQRFIGKTTEDDINEVTEIVTGATYSSNAASNAVFVALQFVSNVVGG